MKFKNDSRGFTLIELLVVIAIIGILASVVLASLNSARSKGNDAKIKGQLSNARAAAELYYSTNTNYGALSDTACTSMKADTASGFKALMSVTTNWPGGTLPNCITNGTASVTATAWSASAALSDGTYWCVDSTGASKSETATNASSACA